MWHGNYQAPNGYYQLNAFKAQVRDEKSKVLVAEEIKAVVLNYLKGPDNFALPENLQEDEN